MRKPLVTSAFGLAASVFIALSQPSADARSTAAAEDVTIFARPTIVRAEDPWTTLFGSIESRKAGEAVTIQARDCGSEFFRVVDGATTQEGGGWSTRYSPGISTTLRAIWNDKASNQVPVRQRAGVYLRRLARTTFRIGASGSPRGGMSGGAVSTFWGRRALFQRFDRRRGTWITVKQVVLTQKNVVGTEFRASLPKGTLVRAVLPLSQARPCYLRGVSFTLRT